MRIWLGMVTCIAMAGCAQPHTPISAPMTPARNVQAEMEATAVRCEKQHPMDKDRKPMTPFMACFMDAEVQYWTGKNEFRRTVALQSKAESLAIAEQYDAGKISRQRLQAELQLVGEYEFVDACLQSLFPVPNHDRRFYPSTGTASR